MGLLLTGVIILVVIVGLFWLKDRLRKPLLARFVYSGLVARVAVVGAAFVLLGSLLLLADWLEKLF